MYTHTHIETQDPCRSDSRGGGGGGDRWRQKIIKKYKVDSAAEMRLDRLPTKQAENVLRQLDTGSIRNPSAFVMKAVQNAQSRDDR
eukprot:2033566-Amphidinium_carterae.1